MLIVDELEQLFLSLPNELPESLNRPFHCAMGEPHRSQITFPILARRIGGIARVLQLVCERPGGSELGSIVANAFLIQVVSIDAMLMRHPAGQHAGQRGTAQRSRTMGRGECRPGGGQRVERGLSARSCCP